MSELIPVQSCLDLSTLINEINACSWGGHITFPKIVNNPDLSDFQKQGSNLESADFEWVKQMGDDDYGFHGETVYQLTGDSYLIMEWHE